MFSKFYELFADGYRESNDGRKVLTKPL